MTRVPASAVSISFVGAAAFSWAKLAEMNEMFRRGAPPAAVVEAVEASPEAVADREPGPNASAAIPVAGVKTASPV